MTTAERINRVVRPSALEIRVAGARAVAHADGLGPRLGMILGSVAEQPGAASAPILVVTDEQDRLDPAASVGLSDSAPTAPSLRDG